MKYERKKVKEKVRKIDPKTGIGKIKTNTWFVCFFKCSLIFLVHALQSELNKVSVFNSVRLQLQSIGSKIERVFEKTNKIFHQNRSKKDIY